MSESAVANTRRSAKSQWLFALLSLTILFANFQFFRRLDEDAGADWWIWICLPFVLFGHTIAWTALWLGFAPVISPHAAKGQGSSVRTDSESLSTRLTIWLAIMVPSVSCCILGELVNASQKQVTLWGNDFWPRLSIGFWLIQGSAVTTLLLYPRLARYRFTHKLTSTQHSTAPRFVLADVFLLTVLVAISLSVLRSGVLAPDTKPATQWLGFPVWIFLAFLGNLMTIGVILSSHAIIDRWVYRVAPILFLHAYLIFAFLGSIPADSAQVDQWKWQVIFSWLLYNTLLELSMQFARRHQITWSKLDGREACS